MKWNREMFQQTRVSKKIHQVWIDIQNEMNRDPYFPEKYVILSQSWILHNETYQYKRWNGYDMDRFIRKYYGQYYDMYIHFPKWIYRCDFFRYAVLHRLGGVYVDIDFVCVRSLPEWTHKVVLFSDCKPNISYCGINNCLLVSEPRHPFWLEVMDEIQRRYLQHPTLDVVQMTGPSLLNDLSKTKPLDVYIEKDPCLFFSYHYTDRDAKIVPTVQPCTIGYHLWDYTWKDLSWNSSYTDSLSNLDANQYDLILIGGGMFGLLFAHHMYAHKRILILEAGGIELTKHIGFYHQMMSPQTNSSVWKLPHNPIYLQSKQTKNPYALGGKSPYWGGWVTIPSLEDLGSCDDSFIENYIQYQEDAMRLLHVTKYDPPSWISSLHPTYKSLLHQYPLCIVEMILENPHIKVMTHCKTLRLIYSSDNTSIQGLMTTKGYLDVRNNQVLLSCGTFEIGNLLLNSNFRSTKMQSIGIHLNDHVFTRMSIRLYPSHRPLDRAPFVLKPFRYCYIQFDFPETIDSDTEGFVTMTIDAFVSVTSKEQKFVSADQKYSNEDGSYKLNLNYVLSDEDLWRWDHVDSFLYDFLETHFSEFLYEVWVHDHSVRPSFSSKEEQKIFFQSFRQPLVSSYHEMGVTPYGSIVDIHSQVKTMTNVFILGPSVLPLIEGNNNALLTTCMLLRMSDYLKSLPPTPKRSLETIRFTEQDPWIVIGDDTHVYQWNADRLTLRYRGKNWALLWLQKELPFEYKVTMNVYLPEKGVNSGIFLNFSNPMLSLSKNKLSFVQQTGLEIQLLKENDPTDSQEYTGKLYDQTVPYVSKVSVYTMNFVEIVKKDHFIIVYVNHTLSTYSPISAMDTSPKYMGFQWHAGGNGIVEFSNIRMTDLV